MRQPTTLRLDPQFVAIARAEGAHAVYSDDEDVIAYATRAGLAAYRTLDLDLPPEDPRRPLDFGGRDA